MREANVGYMADLARLVSVLGMDGSALLVRDDVSAGVRPDLEAGQLVIGSRAAMENEASTVAHEIGHLMITRPEAVGSRTWGMDSPNQIVVGGRIENAGSFGPSQIRHECKAWAWQWIIEEACGLIEPNAYPPERTEAQYLDKWDSLGADDKARLSQIAAWQQEYRTAIEQAYPDPLQAIRERIQDLPRLLANRAAFEGMLLTTPQSADEFHRGNTRAALLVYHDGDATIWGVILEAKDSDYRRITSTGDEGRARRYLARVVENNRLEPGLAPWMMPKNEDAHAIGPR